MGHKNFSRDYESDRFIKSRDESSGPPRGKYTLRDEDQADSAYQMWSPTNAYHERKIKDEDFFGKGPKGFKRSDERIREEVCEALYSHRFIDASDIEVFAKDGEITLRGTVADRKMKRSAEDCVESVPGVTDIQNEIRVQPNPSVQSKEQL